MRGPKIPQRLTATSGALTTAPSGALTTAPSEALTTALSVLRTGFGTIMIATPRTLPRGLGVDAATSSRVTWLVRMVGYREVALGAGTLLARRRGEGAASWLLGQALADAGDAAAVATAWRHRKVAAVPAAALVGFAVAGAAAGVRSARRAGA